MVSSETLTVKGGSTLVVRYQQVRAWTLVLCEPLQPEDFVVQPIVDVSPPKWHLAHTTWFFETFLLRPHAPGYPLFHKEYNYLFNSYYESIGTRALRTDRGNLTRPTTAEIVRYRQHVDVHMVAWLEKNDLSAEQLHLLELGLQHEQQHQELLVTDFKYILGHNPLWPVYRPEAGIQNPTNTMAEVTYQDVPEGLYSIGHQGEGFCFDNELGVHQVWLHAFRFRRQLVTNAEYEAFVADGGYQQPTLWLAEGWDWVQRHGVRAPLYWHRLDAGWHHYTLGGLQPVCGPAPVTHISYYEADAYARWAGQRLLTEFEWETACRLFGQPQQSAPNFVEHGHYHPQISAPQDLQMIGNAWEWTSSAYLPYPYYAQAPGALGEYNGKFMINQMVLRGGSCATPASHFRTTYRNFFHPDKQWQFTGIRLATYA